MISGANHNSTLSLSLIMAAATILEKNEVESMQSIQSQKKLSDVGRHPSILKWDRGIIMEYICR